MAEERPPRHVSGEFLVAPTRGAARRPSDVVDASFETVRGESLAPMAAPIAGLAVLAGSDGGTRRGGPAFWSVGLLLVFGAFWFSGGHSLFLGGGPAPVEIATPAFDLLDLSSRVERIDGHAMLLVDGAVQNTGMATAPAPPVVINVVDEDGATTRYRLGLGERPVAPGDTAGFSSRLSAPQGGVRRVYVTFGGE